MEVFDAELHAVYEALTAISADPSLRNGMRHAYICIDNRAALQVLAYNHKNNLGASMATTAGASSAFQKIIIRTVWTPSHCGIPGNEAADKLAKAGTAAVECCRHAYTSTAWMTRIAQAKFIEKWRSQVGNPSLSWQCPQFWKNLNFHNARQVFRVYSGRTDIDPLPWEEPQPCRCGAGALTSKHVVESCPLFDNLRDRIRGPNIAPPQITNTSILDSDKHQKIMEFIRAVGLGSGGGLKWPVDNHGIQDEVQRTDVSDDDCDEIFEVGDFE
jgi:hypothetical protein